METEHDSKHTREAPLTSDVMLIKTLIGDDKRVI